MDTDFLKYYTLEHSSKYMPKKYYVQNVEAVSEYTMV